MRTKTLKNTLALLLAALALTFFAACSDDSDDSDATLSASSLNGTTWSGSVSSTLPLSLEFTSTTNVTIVVNSALNVTCTYEISGDSIIATGTGNYSGNSITFNVTSYTGSSLNVTVTSSSGDYFSNIPDNTSITFTKS